LSRKALQRQLLLLKLRRLWIRSSGHPPAVKLIEVLSRRLAQKERDNKAGQNYRGAVFSHRHPRPKRAFQG